MSRYVEATDPGLRVPPGARLLHVGPPKTGTTALQKAAASQRQELRRQGVLYPGKGHSHRRAAFRFAGRTEGWGTPRESDRALWQALLDEVRAEPERRVWLSSESLAELEPALVGRLLQELGGQAHVAFTLRPLPALVASAWSQYLKTGLRVDFEAWVAGVLAEPPEHGLTPSFRRRLDVSSLVRTWLEAVGPERLTLVVLDPDDHDLVPRTFETLLALRPGTLTGVQLRGDASNRSFTRAEAELVRRLNEHVRSRGRTPWPDYERYVRNSTVPSVLRRVPAREEPRIVPPRWAVERVVELAEEQRRALEAMDVRVVGDLARLALPAAALDEPVRVQELPVEAALAGLAACLEAGMEAERRARAAKGRPAPPRRPTVDELPTATLARTLAGRAAKAARRRVRSARPG